VTTPVTDQFSAVRRGSRAWWMAAVLAALFLAGHLPFLASTLEDVDSANFALGLRDFDPGRHRPHPPGYPIYIAAAKAAATLLSEPRALALWGVVFGALSAFALLRLFAGVDVIDGIADGPPGGPAAAWDAWFGAPAGAMLVTLTAPLVWMTASRPMSDTLGFAAVVTAQALIATALVQQARMRDVATGRIDAAVATRSGRLLLVGALASAIAIGVRSQATWLTVPLLAAAIVTRRRREALAALAGCSVWFTGGVMLWLVPLVLASGGPSKYLAAFANQAGEDWSGVDLLATHPTPRKLAFALYETCVIHWAGLGWLVLAAAALGTGLMLLRRRRGLLVLTVAFAPYALFHLGFQETFTTRYAMPLVPPMAYLAVRGLLLLGRVASRAAIVALACTALALTVPVVASYSSVGSPTARALADLTLESSKTPAALLGMHHAFARAVEAGAPETPAWQPLASPPKHEWLSLVRAWNSGDTRPVWFLADPRRTDLALIDPEARSIQGDYAWPFTTQVFLGGIRPDQLAWVVIRQPGWFAEEGWPLTPETAGVARADGRGLEHGPLVARVKRRETATTLMIGGRHLGLGAGVSARVEVTIDGRGVDSWTVAPANGLFLRFLAVPAGALAGDGSYAKLEIQSWAAGSTSRTGIVAIDQFDVQDAGTVVRGYETGWNEPEYNPATGQTWRWATERATITTTTVDRDVILQVAGESPMKYFVRPTRVAVKVGDQAVFSQGVAEDFAWSIKVPSSALAQSGGRITIESDQSFRPADRGQNADHRSLALRIYSVTLKPVSGPGTAANSRTAATAPAAPGPPR